MAEIICQNCGKRVEHHAKQMCITCYKKIHWQPKPAICKRCARELPLHAKGLCVGCYNSVFHIDKVKEANYRKYHNIEPELYKKLTQKCALCGFDKIVELHHIDLNRSNNSEKNLIGICPNHHKMIHHRTYRTQIFALLKEKGFEIPNTYKDDEFFKQNP